jgi:hypothetical protein
MALHPRSTGYGLLIVLVTFIMAVPIQPGLAVPDPSNVLSPLPAPEVSLVDALLMDQGSVPQQVMTLPGLVVVDEYDNFVHIQAPQSTLDILTSLGLDLRPLDNLHMIAFDQVVFDTRDGEPVIPSPLSDERTDLYIVQLRGPSKDEWKAELSGYGTLLEPGLYYCFIMRLPSEKVPLVAALDYVTWVGKYHPYYKIKAGFDEVIASGGSSRIIKATVIFYKGTGEDYERGLGAIKGLGGEVLLRDDTTHWWDGARIQMPLSALYTIAHLDGLAYIEPYNDPTSRMDRVRWVVQSNDPINESTPIWDQGLHGEGIIVGGADTGIDLSHVAFRNNISAVGVPGPNNRKVVQYNTSIDDGEDSSFHGTHTMGVMVGQNVTSPTGYYRYDGLAFRAKIAFYDVVLPDGTYAPPSMWNILQDAYDHGARSHSDSWGDDTTAYTSRAQGIDQFQWDHYEFLTFIAPGNTGIVYEPATAKDCVSVGNAYNGQTKDIASSSAVGPTNTNMINPHIVAPGMSIITPQGDMDKYNYNYDYLPLSGTSLSTPDAAGATALIQQYYQDGFYPTGTKVQTNGFNPSGPLKKATLLNSGSDQFGGMKGPDAIGHIPNSQQGWGKVKLDDALYFQNDERGLWVHDGYNASAGAGLETGEKDTFILHSNTTEPLEITMVWNDYPGGSGHVLNDLDLTVLDPLGNLYKGNGYQNGHSVPGGKADANNTAESVLLPDPIEGFYIINVTAVNIQSQVHQRYAIVATGAIHGADQGGVNFDKALYGINDRVGLRVVDADVAGTGKVQVEISSLKEPTPEPVTLDETSIKGIFSGSISMSLGTPKKDGILQVSDNDTLLVEYLETLPAGTRLATSHVDAKLPKISNVRVSDITIDTVTIHWTTDELASSNVTYGPSKALGMTKKTAAAVKEHTLVLTGLLNSTLYYFDVSSSDEVGNQAIDNYQGAHYNFRTATYIIKAAPGFAGWVRDTESFNHFDDGRMYSGYYVDLKRFAVMYFNISEVPPNADFVAVTVRAYGRDRSTLAPAGGTWSLDLLNSSVNHLFKGTTQDPGFDDIATVKIDATLGQKANTELLENQWTTFDVPPSQLNQFDQRLPLHGIALSMVGPTSGANSMFQWDSGNVQGGNSLGSQYAPQLILTVDLRPIVAAGAPSSISMDEDKSASLDLGTVFSDDGPLNYSFVTAPAHLATKITDAVLNLTPIPDWNGLDHMVLKATDENGLYSEHRINITVKPVNDPPRLVSLGGKPITVGMVLNGTQDRTDRYNVVSKDVDIGNEGDLLIYDTNLSWAKVVGNNLTITPTNAEVGPHDMKLTVRDLGGLSDSVSIVIDVANLNDPPKAFIASPMNGTEGYSNLPLVFNGNLSTDPDLPFGDVLTYSWTSSIQGDLGQSVIVTKALQIGKHKITLTVHDKAGLLSLASVNITVCSDANHPDDCDVDGLPDYWERAFDLNPYDPTDAKTDTDKDGFTNLQEFTANTDPTNPKSHPKTTVKEEGAWKSLAVFIVVFLIGGLVVAALFLMGGFGKRKDKDEPKGRQTGRSIKKKYPIARSEEE